MALPSRVLNSGVTSLTTAAICGEGASAVSAAGSTSSDATALTSIYNRISTVAAGSGVKLPPCEMGATIWVSSAREIVDGRSHDPVLGFAATLPYRFHVMTLAQTLESLGA